MAVKKCEVEATLVAVTLHEKLADAAKGQHLLGTTLIWPRIGTARKTFATTLKLEQGAWQSGARPWSETILFKETLQGSFGFEVTVTEKLTDAQTDEFLRNMASQFVKVTAAADKLTPPLLESLAALPFNYLVKTILKEKAPKIVASGVIDLDTVQLPVTGQSVRWSVPLLAPEAIKRVIRKKVGQTLQRRSETLFEAGSSVGTCRVDVRVL